jgi:hypothetical protein
VAEVIRECFAALGAEAMSWPGRFQVQDDWLSGGAETVAVTYDRVEGSRM